MRRAALLILPLLSATLLTAQNQHLSGVSSRWSDSFVEWEVYAMRADTSEAEDEEASEYPDEEMVGEIKQRWLNVRDDWTDWDFQVGDLKGTIRQKWRDDRNQWELRTYDGNVITMRTAWPNDFKEWRVSDNSISLNLRSRWTNQLDEWLVDDRTRGRFYLYTLRERDPRDWAIEDTLDESVSPAMKIALIFLTVFHGSPRM
ncbi:MAG: hypothetical protein IT259_07165 [Saprospiraceae bacterium]|nr:hypothetical protein [Saprospiraceae bacterium]